METTTMSPEAKEARNAYQRGYMKKYRKENPNHINEFWERKAQKAKERETTTTANSATPMEIMVERIHANEKMIKAMLAENKRLIKELAKTAKELAKYQVAEKEGAEVEKK